MKKVHKRKRVILNKLYLRKECKQKLQDLIHPYAQSLKSSLKENDMLLLLHSFTYTKNTITFKLYLGLHYSYYVLATLSQGSCTYKHYGNGIIYMNMEEIDKDLMVVTKLLKNIRKKFSWRKFKKQSAILHRARKQARRITL